MSSNTLYKGTRWYKCDMHLHTTASNCFEDKTVTPKEWVDKAIEQGLNCAAVTDHNNSKNIDQIKLAAEGTSLTVFPGVEITCSDSKVHLLIIFDVTKTSADVRDFLIRAGFKDGDFDKDNISTKLGIFDIAELATSEGAIIIPAHIDEYSGLGSISVENLKRFFSEYDINAVQVVHEDFLSSSFKATGNTEFKEYLNDYYNNPNPVIDDATVKEWYSAVKYALEEDCAILTFSDNPSGVKNSKHGLWGIGNNYAWIKMDETPSIEGMRQSFLLPDFRVKNKFNSPNIPYKCPELWIKSIKISNTSIIDETEPLIIDFNPQLNTIIGGRGSGKSSILRFIRGVFNRTAELTELVEILKDHNEFYQQEDSITSKGVLNDSSVIEVEFIRNDILHKINASNIKNSSVQDIKISKFNNEERDWEDISDEGYIDFFEFDYYSQKQIFEIAQKPNALRERIDNSIEEVDKLKLERESIRNIFLEKSTAIRTIEQIIVGKGKIETRIKDLDNNIKKLQQSGIADLLLAKGNFSREEELLKKFSSEIEKKEIELNSLAQTIELEEIDFSCFNEDDKSTLEPISKAVIDGFKTIKRELDKLKKLSAKIKEDYDNAIELSEWKTKYDKANINLELKKSELEEEGIDDILNFEKLSKEKSELENELQNIIDQSEKREILVRERKELQSEYLIISKSITLKRKEFVNSILNDDKVKINIKPFRNQKDFELKLRKIIQRDNNAFQTDIDKLSELCFNGNVENKIKEFRDVILKIRANEDVNNIVTGRFINLVNSLSDAQIDEFELLFPEDEIEVLFRPTPEVAFRSLSTASAGQKTTAILTFILSYGNIPLILDQPEDDLDNRLVYELIVDRLKQVKECRQLIVVTHNANIPVNADAEYIISMGSAGKKLKVLNAGTVEQTGMKKEICDVMEGGETAFNMRLKRYKQIK